MTNRVYEMPKDLLVLKLYSRCEQAVDKYQVLSFAPYPLVLVMICEHLPFNYFSLAGRLKNPIASQTVQYNVGGS
jgi:hypothetical protein